MNIAVFCGSSNPVNQTYNAAAQQLGAALAHGGHTLVYGGSNLGLMGTVSGAALAAGGSVTGVIPTFFSEEIITSQRVTQLVRVASMAERKELIISMSDAFIALPGGIGTIDEVSEVMVANQLGLVRGRNGESAAPEGRRVEKPMLLLNLDGFYDAFLAQLELIKAQGLMRSEAGLRAVGSVAEAMSLLHRLLQ